MCVWRGVCVLPSGDVGVGITIGGEPAAYIIEHHLSRFVEGQDANNVEAIWDQVRRPHSIAVCVFLPHHGSLVPDVPSNGELWQERAPRAGPQCR